MKKKAVLALTLAGLVALQVPMVALAEDRTTKIEHTDGTYTYTYDNINVSDTNAVNAINSGTRINVTAGNITTTTSNIIQAKDGGQITVTADNISANSNSFSAAICLDGNGSSVTVTGARTSGTTATVAGGNNSGEGVLTRSSSQNGTATVNANVSGDNAVNIKGSNSNITVTGNVTGVTTGINAVGAGSVVNVTGDVVSAKKAINATNGTTVEAGSAANGVVNQTSEATVSADNASVTVTGAVTNNGNGYYSWAISASNGATVIAGSATNGAEGQENPVTIKASDPGTTVIIEAKEGVEGATGDVTNKGDYNGAVWADSGATVVIEGTAKSNNADNETIVLSGENSKVIVYKIENTGNSSKLIEGDEQNVFYIIKGMDSEGINLAKTTGLTSQTVLAGTTYEKTYQTAKGEEEIKVAVESGYEVKAGTIQVTKNADGTFSIKVPVGGGVTLETIKKAVEAAQAQEEEKKATVTGSEGNAVAGGSWNCGPGETWTYRNNGIFKDTWGYITLSNGRTGWFWFDNSGVMATGWKEINGKWYYFNEAHDGTYGMMLANTTTPDGKKVGADGAMIQ